ncbi:MAG: hypothetical protein ACTH2Y_04160 [Corynebacterium sp.]|uniref:hypothetical protein n=1 Tax=unclassified Corynebacterium TaxID=2624378 RepID=UPI002649022B|nr:hypothetical protein [Corynebacterium sp.]MDN5583180.1 hypothetical protein [Corynebacterium sp.]MDN5721007.1 hypothetical protein [Corynebacterium sp.]MDN6325390.1 hypothetical protein [Corynebacterium sp.]MDN6510858.1 hypothetical protein [Corynebacterium sp.]
MTSPFGSSPASDGPTWSSPGSSSPGSPSGSPSASPGFASSPGGFTPGGAPSAATPSDGPSSGPVSGPVTGPWAFVATATATAVLGVVFAVIAVVTGSPTDFVFRVFALAGWALAGIVTFILLGVHTAKDTRRRAENFYVETSSQAVLYKVAIGVACVGVIATAIEIALWISKTVGA